MQEQNVEDSSNTLQELLEGCQQKELQGLQIQGKVFYLLIAAAGCK